VRLLLHGVRWKDYVVAREALDNRGLRMTFCEGEFEPHEPAAALKEWREVIRQGR
jgi:hypothetical protein